MNLKEYDKKHLAKTKTKSSINDGFVLPDTDSLDYWPWLIILLCPLMHLFIMKGHGHERELYKCPECGLEYKEKEWAEKCEAWCRKNKSCNLEITKHAIKNESRTEN
ncbi:DUF2933 domain-containing protein [Patescibacteria group bacterium]|nr:DUF2933 domain-containing protein [Patescibacteria group bacterium]